MKTNYENIDHFITLRTKINQKLGKRKEQLSAGEEVMIDYQIAKYTWLFGALGQVPSDVMFIAENPSIAGITHADIDTIDGLPPDIEAQWWGGKKDNAATVFRPFLFEVGLKKSPPQEKGGWNCYITNLIKRANIAKLQEDILSLKRIKQENYWSDILRWEIEKVQPKVIYCLGRKSEKAVRRFIREGILEAVPVFYLCHYSARGNIDNIRELMVSQYQDSRKELIKLNL
jgi:hypothetical protein